LIGTIIQARTGSTRLPNKIFKEVDGKPIIKIQYGRVKKSKLLKKIIIATTTNSKDESVIKFCQKNNIDYFRGPENDVLTRYYECAKKYKLSIIVRLTSDCPLIDPYVIDEVIKTYLSNNYDFIANTVPTETSKWPDGSDVEIFSFKSLENAYFNCKDIFFREHVTFYFWKLKKKLFKTFQLDNDEDLSKYRYTIDYEEDLMLIKEIVSRLKKRKLFGRVKEITDIIKKDDNLLEINRKYNLISVDKNKTI